VIAGLTTSFRVELATGVQSTEHQYAFALYGPGAPLSKRTRQYGPAGEIRGQGYQPGGKPTGPMVVGVEGEIVTFDWQLPAWEVATIKAAGGLLYNLTTGGSVAVLDFGGEVASQNGPFLLRPSGPLVRWR
jgi:hypothetical protein